MDFNNLPKHWEVEQLKDVTLKTELANPNRSPQDTFIYVDVSSVSNETYSITESKELLGAVAPSRARKRIQTNDVIFATVRPTLKRIALVPSAFNGQICSTGYCVIKTKRERLAPRFTYYYLLTEHIAERVEQLQKGATYPAINDSDLFAESIILPPLPEQRAIAKALKAVQDAIAARRRELELERERKAALMQHLFTKGTRNEPTKQTEIGEMPDSWKISRLEIEFESQLGKMLSQKAKIGSNPKPYVRNANVQWGKVDCSGLYEMDFNEREMKKFRLKVGDILVCEGATGIGRTAIWKDDLIECYFQKAIHRLRPRSNEMNSNFFVYWMERAFRFSNVYGVAGTQTTIAHLPQEKLNAMKLPKPDLQEQKIISSTLLSCDKKIDALEKELNLLEELFKAMLEELMTGRLSAVHLIQE
jgi:type I restriction enzyme S subunit